MEKATVDATYAGPDGELLDGTIIPVTAGTELAFPQVQARPQPAPYERYYVGEGSSLVPWAQMEFPVSGLTGAGGHGNLCFRGLAGRFQRHRHRPWWLAGNGLRGNDTG